MDIIDELFSESQPEAESCIVRRQNNKIIPIYLDNIFKDQSCFIVATGPSFNLINNNLLNKPGILTLGLNNSIKTFRTNMWICVDSPARFLESIWRDPKIMKFCPYTIWARQIWNHEEWELNNFIASNNHYSKIRVDDCPNVYYMMMNDRFDNETFFIEKQVNWGNHASFGGGRSVLIAAIKLLYILGIKKIYLTGVDFKMTSSYKYHFEEERRNGAINNNIVLYRKMHSYFAQLLPHMIKEDFEIINCSPNSDLTLFPYMKFEDAIDLEISKIPNPTAEQTLNMYYKGR